MWPQWVMLVLLVLGLGISMGMDGKPRTNHSFWQSVINTGITFALLYFGGFWKGMF